MAEEVKLFRTWSSPFPLRIIWAMKLKGIEYETIFEDLSNKSHLLLHYNPVYKKVPVLVHNGKPISESLVILEYIDETWKQPPLLLPEDPYERAMARFWAKFCDEKVLPPVADVLVTQGKEQEAALAQHMENMKRVEEELKGKKFFGGEAIGFADIAYGWMANLLSVMEEVTGLKLTDAEAFPAISTWLQSFSDVPLIKENWPPREKLVSKYQAFREKRLALAAEATSK
ncbi:glutathione transferase GST 23-like [Diospyros lotus]|uniref:glutathione transferase GST 23-like n=1 Tax=Diospyros lotus TaxID=55363 RepID=UPI00225641D0|nr:glutathione transferase GST 23-like [Diospyros lotus]